MAIFLCECAFEDDDGRERVWDVYGSYIPSRPPPWTNGDHDSPSFSDSGDPEEIEIEYAEEAGRRVDQAELGAYRKRIEDRVRDDPPEPPTRGRARRFED